MYISPTDIERSYLIKIEITGLITQLTASAFLVRYLVEISCGKQNSNLTFAPYIFRKIFHLPPI